MKIKLYSTLNSPDYIYKHADCCNFLRKLFFHIYNIKNGNLPMNEITHLWFNRDNFQEKNPINYFIKQSNN